VDWLRSGAVGSAAQLRGSEEGCESEFDVREGGVGYLRVHITLDLYGDEAAFADEGERGLSFEDDVTAARMYSVPGDKEERVWRIPVYSDGGQTTSWVGTKAQAPSSMGNGSRFDWQRSKPASSWSTQTSLRPD
jgi:hypothetical protein